MAFKKILVAYDGSTYSKKAFNTALELAEIFNSEITVVSCIDVYASGWLGRSYFENAVLKKLRGKIMSEIGKLEKTANKKGIFVKGKIFDTPSIIDSIIQFSKSGKFELIVVGSHGWSGIKKALLGSISHGIVQRSSIPVLIVK